MIIELDWPMWKKDQQGLKYWIDLVVVVVVCAFVCVCVCEKVPNNHHFNLEW